MQLQRYQWVGLLAGVPLFSGAWLSAFYNTPWWGVLGILFLMAGVHAANRVERRSSVVRHAVRGLIAGMLAGLVARMLGLVSAGMVGGIPLVSSTALQDVFRIVLAGSWWSSFVMIVFCGVVGALIASLEPEAKSVTRRKV